jgi:hypothetical protein
MVGEKTPKADIDEISSASGKPGAVQSAPTTRDEVSADGLHNQIVLLGLIAATIYRYKSGMPPPEWLKALGTSR